MIATHKREALLRLKTVRGHIDGVIGMVEGEVYCPDVMKQVAALQASLEKVNRSLDPAAVSATFGIYRVRGRNGEPCLVAANSSTLLRGMLPLPQASSKGITLNASPRTWSGPRRRETSASPPGSGSPSYPAR
jgi:CsoR family transcriptional regulator, copper-sensing transcriptional repressor